MGQITSFELRPDARLVEVPTFPRFKVVLAKPVALVWTLAIGDAATPLQRLFDHAAPGDLVVMVTAKSPC